MRNAQTTGKQRRQPQHHQLTAPPLWPRDEWSILSSGVCDDIALLLWHYARSVRLWATTPVSDRVALFSPPAAETAEWEADTAERCETVAQALRTIGAVVRYPDLIQGPPIAAACGEVATWADAAGRLGVALEFAEAAALIDSEAARPAADAGHLATRLAAYDRSWIWLTRCVKLARRAKDWEWYVRGHIRFGIMLYELGQHARARPHYWRATRAALDSGRRTLAGKAQHDLLLIEAEAGSYLSGEKCARRVLEYYPRVYERIPHFVHDYAYLLVRHGYYAPALPLAEAVLAWITQPFERIAVLATLARAGAGLADRAQYEHACAELMPIAEETEINTAAALVAAAEGATAWSEWDRARTLALRARTIAEKRREGDPLRRANALLARIKRREMPNPGEAPPAVARIDEIAAACMRRLNVQRAPKRGVMARRIVAAGMAVSTASSP